MGKFSPPAVEESVSVNVVPLVDIMFLLLLFLMIGGDMSHRESTVLQLPQADKARESNPDLGDLRYCIVNIHTKHDSMDRSDPAYGLVENWQYAIAGVEYPDYFALLDRLKVISQTKLEEKAIEGSKPPHYLSAVLVTIRADKDAPYKLVQDAMMACSQADLYKIEVGAAKPAAR
jgi:biopolymer transport protein ExbD